MFIVINKNGEFYGTVYEKINTGLKIVHEKKGDTLVEIFGINQIILSNDNDDVVFDDEKINELLKNYLIVEKQKAFNSAIETHLDNKAKEFRYDNIMSARSYAGYDNPFQAEAKKLAVWASNCWVKAGEIEADIESGKRDMPTIYEVLSELPIYQ